MRPFLTFILLLNGGLLFGQNFAYPSIKQKGFSIKDFVPPGWTILDSAMGDLNNDKQLDVILILQHIDSVSLVNNEDDITDTVLTQPRVLLILFKNTSDNLFHLSEQSNTFILTHDDPFSDDPYQSTTISKGILQISFYWYPNSGNWFNSTVYKFRYRENNFFLIGVVYEERNKATHDYNNYSYNFLTKKRILIIGNDYKKNKKTEIKSLDTKIPKTLKTLEHTWEVENGVDL